MANEKGDDQVEEDENIGMRLLGSINLVRAESMELNNDPRFFSKNVIDQRLKAFASLTFIGSLMIKNSLGQCFALKKDIELDRIDGIVQLLGFFMMSVVLFCNVISVLVLAHQVFYTYRLLTAGPTGFESAASFYLNRNMIVYRHFAVKCLLLSLPLFVLSSGFSLFKKFDEVGLPPEEPDFMVNRILATIVFFIFITVAAIVIWIRWSHVKVFRRLYGHVKESEAPLMSQMQQIQAGSQGGFFIAT